MKTLIYPENYSSLLDIVETQKAIKLLKNCFEYNLSTALDLKRVSAPLFVDPKTGLNDDLNGVEKAVGFDIYDGTHLEIVHSLAKWKRFALYEYNLKGLYTDMNAIRANEELDNIHSLYVDQWDWEKVITDDERTISYLQNTVKLIYDAFLKTYEELIAIYPILKQDFASEVYFVSSSSLQMMYPNLSPKQREEAIVNKYKTVFISSIGNSLSDGVAHDSRAADYDDWDLNGDLFIYSDILKCAVEISSMGIRVNKESLNKQLIKKNETYKLSNFYHQAVINDILPLTIGGGIGQSRLCLILLKKAHIGEVQSSYWSKEDIEEFKKHNIIML